MTRNNLAEHLRWLLQERPSQHISRPRQTRDNISLQPQVSDGRAASYTNEGIAGLGNDFDDDSLMEQSDQLAERPVQSTRGLVQVHATSPNVTARTTERLRTTRRTVQAPISAQMAVPQTPEALKRFHDIGEDVEVLDMTDGLERMLSPSRSSKTLTKQTIPHKRKSDEFDEIDQRDTPQALSRRQQTPAADRRKATSADQEMPEGPPPPYSTVAPHNPRKVGSNVQLGNDAISTLGIDEDPQGDVELFDFSNKRAQQIAKEHAVISTRNQAGLVPSPDSSSHLKHDLATKHLSVTVRDEKSASEEERNIPSQSVSASLANAASSEELDLLKRFFALSEDSIQQIGNDLAKRLDATSVDIAYLYDEGDKDDEVAERELELRSLTAVQDAFILLQKSAKKMQWLAAKRDEQFDNLKTAIKQLNRTSTEQARVANRAAKAELESFEKECLVQLRLCKADVERAVSASQQADVPEEHVAIEASQFPERTYAHLAPAGESPARIAQTQAAVNRPSMSITNGMKASSRFNHTDAHQQPTLQDSAQQAYTTARSKPISLAQDTSFYDFGIDDEFPIDEDDFCELEADIVDTVKFAQHSAPPKETSSNIIPGLSKTKSTIQKNDGSQLASLFNHPWSNDVKRILKEQFRLQGFRQGQLEAINATLAGRDAFVLMPTGGGKSLCYQLPSQIKSGKTHGVTIVVSPLLSLMEDQVQHLRKLNIQAFLLNGDTAQSERKHIWDTMSRRDVNTFIQILYITPEMLSKSQAMISSLDRLYANNCFARLVIDEAHCVSQWGHDFRPDYKLIGEVRRKYPSVPVMALTATATDNVKVDTIHNLGIDGCKVFTRSFNRPNLYYEVRQKGKSKDVLANIAALIKEKHNKQTGIIYCLSRKNCEETATALREKHGIGATHYHAGMKAAEKSDVQKAWQAGRWHVIVATIAFGMGIDKSNVRFVIHHSVPKSLEGYYQETGRAGRDGGKSSCYLYFSFSDVSKLRRMIEENEDGSRAQKDRQLVMLREMVQYCDNKADCRRVQVLRYFSEVFQKHDCHNGCDVCASSATFTMQDVTELAANAIDIVRSYDEKEEKVTLLRCVDAFRGASSKYAQSTSDAAGSGKDLERGEAERLFYALVAEGALEEYQVMNMGKFPVQYIKLGPRARVNHLELAMRLSPNGKPKGISKRAKKAAPELPLSTNVSSPIQAISARRRKNVTAGKLDKYKYDNFMIHDDDQDDEDYEESDNDAFESMPTSKVRPRAPPITTDGVLDDLDPNHQAMVADFVDHASQKVREITSKDRLRGALFPDSILRQMAIRWTETPAEMKRIPGIVPAQVDHYGQEFCRLVRQWRMTYDEMIVDTGDTAGTAKNPNGNVIDLCTDDEDNDDNGDEYGDFDGLDVDEEDLITSSARPISAEVAAFNERFAESQSAANRIKPAAEPKNKGSWKNKKRGYRAVSGAGRGEASSRNRKDLSNWPEAGKRSGGVKKSAARRANDGSARAKAASKSSFISAMPT